MRSKKRAAPAAAPPYIADHEAEMLVKIAKDFFANPRHAEEYRQWHNRKYGCWPDENAAGAAAG